MNLEICNTLGWNLIVWNGIEAKMKRGVKNYKY